MVVFGKSVTYQGVSTRAVRYTPLGYTGYTAGDNSGQIYSIYYPHGPRPAAGWSWMLFTIRNSFNQSQRDYADASSTVIQPSTATNGGVAGAPLVGAGILYQCLLNNIAVVAMQVTSANTANPTGTVPVGEGRFHAPGGTSGLYEGRANQFGEKDAVLGAQHIRHNAASYGLNPDSWGTLAVSGGATALAYMALAPDRKLEFGTYGPFHRSTVPNVNVLLSFVPTTWDYITSAASITLFPNAENATTVAATMAAAPPRYLRSNSISHYLSMIGSACIPPTYYWSLTQGQSSIFGMPYQSNIDSAAHSIWYGLTLKNLVARDSVFLACSAAAKIAAVGTVDMTAHFDRVDVEDVDAEGVADSPGSISDPTPIGHILRNINRPRWDATVPPEGIWRREQVNTTGRFCVPPARGGRKRVRVTCTSTEGQSGLLVGSGLYSAETLVKPGQVWEYTGSGALWMRAYGGALSVARYEAGELPN